MDETERHINDYISQVESYVYILHSPRHDGQTHAVFTKYDDAASAGETLKATGLYEFHEYFVDMAPVNPKIKVRYDWSKG